MKNSIIKQSLTYTVVVALSMILLSSCTKKFTFLNSPVVPAATGDVTIKEDKNKNYAIDLSVTNLAEPERLTPPKASYTVWMQTDNKGTLNIGNLKTSSGALSKALTGSLKTVTSHKPTGFFITAEDNTDVSYPGTVVVLKTSTY